MAAIMQVDSEVDETTPQVSKGTDVPINKVEAEIEAVLRSKKAADMAQEVKIADNLQITNP